MLPTVHDHHRHGGGEQCARGDHGQQRIHLVVDAARATSFLGAQQPVPAIQHAELAGTDEQHDRLRDRDQAEFVEVEHLHRHVAARQHDQVDGEVHDHELAALAPEPRDDGAECRWQGHAVPRWIPAACATASATRARFSTE